MKYREGFVTNSSSSSYTCIICGHTESGWDLGLSEAEMVECENGHIFCGSHMLKVDTSVEKDEEYDDDDYDIYEMPVEVCPICMFKEWIPEQILDYLIKKEMINKAEILECLKDQFITYKKFRGYIQS